MDASRAAVSGVERMHFEGPRPVAVARRGIAQEESASARQVLLIDERTGGAACSDAVVGASPALRAVMARVAKVAPTDATVLVLGETGTGKELIAHAIQQRSKRARRPFVRVNCAAIPPSLIASELFGHERGAFTEAVQRRLGRFELANGGTIFLDEVGDLPVETQIALLRVLQEREIERVGGGRPIPVDVRVLAATNRDLEADVAAGTFRQDLYFRLNVFPLFVPSLRERGDDVVLLAERFVEQHARRIGKSFRRIGEATLDLLRTHSWPGNVRELQNVIERAVILCEDEVLSIDQDSLGRKGPGRAPQARPGAHSLAATLAERERELIEAALRECHGRVSGPSGAACRLGIPSSTLESKIAHQGIDKQRFRLHAGV